MGSSISVLATGGEDCCLDTQSITSINSPVNAERNVQYFTDTSTGAILIQLPSSPDDGDYIEVLDSIGNFSTNNVTVDGNGLLIEGVASVIMSSDFDSKTFIYSQQGNQWVQSGGSGGGSGTVTGFQNGLTLNGSLGELGGIVTKNTTVEINDTFSLSFDIDGADRGVEFLCSTNETIRVEDTGLISLQNSVSGTSLFLTSDSISLFNTGGGIPFEMNEDGSGIIGDSDINNEIAVASQFLMDAATGQIGFVDGSVLYIEDSTNQKWQITVDVLGNLTTTAIP